MKPLESSLLTAVERRLNALARSDPAFCWRKRHGTVMGVTGDPDLYGCWRGRHFEIELKRVGLEPTILQRYHLGRWQAAGALVFVVHSPQELAAAIDTLRKVVEC